MIKGITVKLHVKTQTGVDDFNAPVYMDSVEAVDNVLVYPSYAQEIEDSINLYGKRADYQLAIPKGDTHTWTDTIIEFFNEKWTSIGPVTEGIEDNIPLMWNKKVSVMRYE